MYCSEYLDYSRGISIALNESGNNREQFLIKLIAKENQSDKCLSPDNCLVYVLRNH